MEVRRTVHRAALRSVCFGVVLALLCGTASLPPSRALTTRAAIAIASNADFTPANGVVSGTGTPGDPFVISGWQIYAGSSEGILVHDTTAHFVIRDVSVSGYYGCNIVLQNVRHASVVNATLSSQGSGGLCAGQSSDVELRSNDATQAQIDVQGSTNVTVADNVLTNGNGIFASSSTNVSISNNRVIGSHGGGVGASYSSNVTIVGNVIDTPASTGIGLASVMNGTAASNEVHGSNYVGIYVMGGDRPVVRGNNVSSSAWSGLRLEYATNATVEMNRFTDDGISIYGSLRQHYDTHTIPPDNLVNGRPLYYYRNCNGTVLDGVPVGQAIFVGCSSIRLANLSIDRTETAITFMSVVNGRVESNRFTGNGASVTVSDSDTIRIVDNWMADNQGGISIGTTANAFVFHNALIRNPYQASDFGGASHTWDNGYPSGGNYYSSYTGTDACSGPAQDVCTGGDGIGDTPVYVGSGYLDRYPLMVPFGLTGQAPTATFTYGTTPITVSYPVWFDASASSDPDGSIVSYTWDFGDGTSRRDAYPSTSKWYDARGTFTVTLTVRDNSQFSATFSRTIRVYSLPVASFTVAPPYPFTNQVVTFNASSSYDLDGTITSYDWTFGDQTTGSGVVVTHVYRNYTGGFSVMLRVTNDVGLVSVAYQGLIVGYDPTPPQSTATYSGPRGENGWFKGTVTAELRATDQGSWIRSIQYRTDGGPWRAYAGPLVFSEGESLLEYHAIDGADNAEAIHSDRVSVDSRAPSITGLHAQGGGAVTIAWDAVDATSGLARFEVSVDHGPYTWVGTNRSMHVTLEDGSHVVSLRAVDVAGNVATSEVRFDVGSGLASPAVLALLSVGIAVAIVAGLLVFSIWRSRRRPGAR